MIHSSIQLVFFSFMNKLWITSLSLIIRDWRCQRYLFVGGRSMANDCQLIFKKVSTAHYFFDCINPFVTVMSSFYIQVFITIGSTI